MYNRISSRTVRCAAVLAALLSPGILAAQGAHTILLVGSVRDSAGHGVPGVEVRIGESALMARTGEGGGFRIGAVPVGPQNVRVRRMGFAPSSVDVTLREARVDSLVISLTAVATTLQEVVVEDAAMTRSRRILAGFWERRSRGFGSFITRAQIQQRNSSQFADLMRMIPSASVMTVNGRNAIRFKRSMGGRDCPPQYWVDGMRIEQGSSDEFAPEDVEAVEVYAGPATMPVQFAPRPYSYTCGAIVIWTRLPGN